MSTLTPFIQCLLVFIAIISDLLCDAFTTPPSYDMPSTKISYPSNKISYPQSSPTPTYLSAELTGLSEGDSKEGLLLYPVISRLAGKNYTGTCKYINEDLVHLSKLRLFGGLRWDINGREVTLSSYITFPNGNTREVVMKGCRSKDEKYTPVLTMLPEEEGPIRMLVSEVGADTILVNEVEMASGKVIMTCSTTITYGVDGKEELVQVSHEVGDNGIEGHQVWKLTELKYVEPKGEGEESDGKFVDTTAR